MQCFVNISHIDWQSSGYESTSIRITTQSTSRYDSMNTNQQVTTQK